MENLQNPFLTNPRTGAYVDPFTGGDVTSLKPGSIKPLGIDDPVGFTLGLGSLAPGIGDALGLANDVRMYATQPESRTLGNYGLSAFGLLPFVPSLAAVTKGAPLPSHVEDLFSKALRTNPMFKKDAPAADKEFELGINRKIAEASPWGRQKLDRGFYDIPKKDVLKYSGNDFIDLYADDLGDTLSVVVNPTPEEIWELYEEVGRDAIRFITDAEGNRYLWGGNTILHGDMANILNITDTDQVRGILDPDEIRKLKRR